MLWQDLALDRHVETERLTRTIADAFDVVPEAVLVVNEIAPGINTDGVAILVHQMPCRGQFALQLSVYVRDDHLWERVQSNEAILAIVRVLCALLDCSCLITGEDLGPGENYLVRPSGEMLRVTLDDDRPDDEFVIVSSRPAGEKAA